MSHDCWYNQFQVFEDKLSCLWLVRNSFFKWLVQFLLWASACFGKSCSSEVKCLCNFFIFLILSEKFSFPCSYDYYSFSVVPAMGELVANDRDSYQYLVESIRRFPSQVSLNITLTPLHIIFFFLFNLFLLIFFFFPVGEIIHFSLPLKTFHSASVPRNIYFWTPLHAQIDIDTYNCNLT